LKAVLSGSKDIDEVIEDHTALIHQNLTNEVTLIEKINDLIRDNEMGTITSVNAEDELESVQDDHIELITSGFNGEEMRQSVESALMQGEDIRARANFIIDSMTLREKATKKQLDDTTESLRITQVNV
jgi:hypothetical protein